MASVRLICMACEQAILEDSDNLPEELQPGDALKWHCPKCVGTQYVTMTEQTPAHS